jgi:hypothetical protein
MKTEQGQKIAGALRAVIKMHSDTSKLLIDCDKHIGEGRKSIFGNYATRDLTWKVAASFWMAEGVSRCYEAGPSLVDSIAATFFHESREIEPLLKVGRIAYRPDATCDIWDLWHLFFDPLEHQGLETILHRADAVKGRIAEAHLIAVPLFSISKIEDVTALMNRVIESSPHASEPADS